MTGIVEFEEVSEDLDTRLAEESAKSFFESLFRSRGEERRSLMEQASKQDAALFIKAALQSYELRGNSDRITLLISVLDKMGRACLAAIAALAGRGGEAEEALAAFIIHADFIPEDERAELLQSFALSPRSETWEKLLDALPCLETETQVPVLAGLAVSKNLALMDTAYGEDLDHLAELAGVRRKRQLVSAKFEWAKTDFRIGFVLETDPSLKITFMPLPTVRIVLNLRPHEDDIALRMRVRRERLSSLRGL